jgi:trimeric autotransporter adhesin
MTLERLLLTLASLLLALPLAAQEFRGSILGQLTDPQGAAVPDAAVTITNEVNGTTAGVRSNSKGQYSAPYLLPGTYAVVVQAAGFKTASRAGIEVNVQDRVTVDFTLEVGSVKETVTITAEAPLLQRNNGDLGQIVRRELIDKLPNIGQSALGLADMAPGVLASGGSYMGNAQNDISINGGDGRNRGNDVTIDGIPNVSARQRGLAVTVPMSDAVEQFKVMTTLFDAAQGRTNGGALALTTRSGTNTLDGTAYLYARNPDWNAYSWKQKQLGQPKPKESYRLWGATVGGPVRLPGYDGRDRTFFFFGYEDIHNASALTHSARVPTALERKGDFSQTLDRNGKPLLIFDPLTGSSTGANRQPFPGGIIPGSRLSPIGLAVLNLYPLPNREVGPPRIGQPNWVDSGHLATDVFNINARLDHQINRSNRAYIRFSHTGQDAAPDREFIPGNFKYPDPEGIESAHETRRNYSFAVNDTITFGSSFVGTISYGYTRARLKAVQAGDGKNPADLGLPASFIGNQYIAGWPQMDIRADFVPSIGSRTRDSINNFHSVLGSFNKLKGNHSFRFGWDYRMLQWNETNPGEFASGQFILNDVLTRRLPGSADGTGSAMAALLLGLPTTTGQSRFGYNAALHLKTHYAAAYFQDDWRVTPKLTLNLGLRYEVETPFTEKDDQLIAEFDEDAALGITAPGLGPLRGGVRFVNQDGASARQGKIDWNNLGPRAGFAYSLNDKTVLRGGYGVFYASYAVNLRDGAPVAASSFNTVTAYRGSVDSNRTLAPGVDLGNPYPNGLNPATGNGLGLLTGLGSSIRLVNEDRVLPYAQQWSLSLQRELPGKTVFEIGYVGTHATALYESLNINETPDEFRRLTRTVPNPFFGLPAVPSSATNGAATIQERKLHRRFPQFENVDVDSLNLGRATYHGLQTKIQARPFKGLVFNASYAFSKIIVYEAASVVNERGSRTVGTSDHPHIFRFYGTCDLPFGRDRAFGGRWSRALDSVLGGWTVSWVTKYTSGNALDIVDSGGARPIIVRDPNLGGPVGERLGIRTDANGNVLNPYFDVTAFQRLTDEFAISPAPRRYGWLRGPSALQHDMVLFKSFKLARGTSLELKVEANNVFNSTNFDDPGLDISNPAQFGVISDASGKRAFRFGGKLRF